jgi:hypothetical protein
MYEEGERDIQEWLACSANHKYIQAKIRNCLENYPANKPQYQSYYLALLTNLQQALLNTQVEQMPY